MPRFRLNPPLRAILAGVMLLAVSFPRTDPPADPPTTPVSFRLADGVQISGRLSTWDRDGFDGSFGRRYWHELNVDDARSLFHRLMDRGRAEHWIDLGRMLLQHEGSERLAESAFRRAIEVEPAAADRIDVIRNEVAQILRDRAERQSQRDEGRLVRSDPEMKAWPADPWPPLTEQERQSARLSMIADAERLMSNAQLTLQAMETEHFLIFSDAPRQEMAVWGVSWLEATYRALSQQLGIADDEDIFWGKPVVMVFEADDRFRIFEAAMFNQYVPRERTAITHYEGPKTFLIAAKQHDSTLMHAAIRAEVTHAMLHRYVSPKRLPPWAHEGLARYFAEELIDRSMAHSGARATAVDLVRSNFPFGELLMRTWDEDSWQGAREPGFSLCHLFVEFLLTRHRESFRAWVRSCKQGTEWREAMVRHFGSDVRGFAEAFYRYYRVND